MDNATSGTRVATHTPRIVIVGAGPAGLGAAWYLHKHGYTNWMLYESGLIYGGMSGSFRDEHGYSWDYAGHAFFSKEPEFNDFIDEQMPNAMLTHRRKSCIYVDRSIVPYPFEDNIRHLSFDQMVECVIGLAKRAGEQQDKTNLLAFLRSTFGDGICNVFMEPYNRKVWAVDLAKMSTSWIVDRMSIPAFKEVFRNIYNQIDNNNWGPNSCFRYPAVGGAGEPYRRFGHTIRDNVQFNHRLVKLDTQAKLATFCIESSLGSITVPYDVLISTIPLPELVHHCEDASPDWTDAASKLVATGVYAVGVGYRAPNSADRDWPWHWCYFPGPDTIYHRIVAHSCYSPDNVPAEVNGEKARSIFFEISYGQEKSKPKEDTLVERCLQESSWKGLIESSQVIDIPIAYPVPTIDRDCALGVLLPELRACNVHSIGRLGGWKYEEGNMDNAFMSGLNTVRSILE